MNIVSKRQNVQGTWIVDIDIGEGTQCGIQILVTRTFQNEPDDDEIRNSVEDFKFEYLCECYVA